MVKKLKLTLEYDGTGFDGWARQPVRPTIEGALRTALDSVLPTWHDLTVAGRTDAGVHASGQVVSLFAEGGPPTEHVAEALNRRLPPEVAVTESIEAPEDFNARFSARARAYRYEILNARVRSALDRRALWYPRPLDIRRLQTAASLIVGKHDFRAFTPTETEHRTFERLVLAARWSGDPGGRLTFRIVADGFLRHMVRTLVGTMLEQEPAQIAELLNGATRDRAGRTASSAGLCLVSVAYSDEAVRELSRLKRAD